MMRSRGRYRAPLRDFNSTVFIPPLGSSFLPSTSSSSQINLEKETEESQNKIAKIASSRQNLKSAIEARKVQVSHLREKRTLATNSREEDNKMVGAMCLKGKKNFNYSKNKFSEISCTKELHTEARDDNAMNTGDRFIPNRSAMDFGFAHYMLTASRKEKENTVAASPLKDTYRKLLAATLLNNRTRILAFRNKAPAPNDGFLSESLSVRASSLIKQGRYISQIPERILDAPDLVDDYYLNLLDWGSMNVLSIALGNTVYLWNASDGSVSELMTIDEDMGPVTSVGWAPDGQHIAVGLNNSHIQLWDSCNSQLLRTLRGVHRSRVDSLAWNKNILTTGGMDGQIVNNDVRIQSHAIQTYCGHTQEVCGLKWSGSGQQLASGGNDNLVHIWGLSMSSSIPAPGQNQWLHRFDSHLAPVKALAWSPFQSNLLASGGGGRDRCIKFWNTSTGACLNSVDTGSQVCSLLWNKNERELLSSHGFPQNQLTLWKYPSMAKIAELTGHTSQVLFMAQSPDGRTVASAGDETLRIWSVFETPEVTKPAANAHAGLFSSYNHIR